MSDRRWRDALEQYRQEKELGEEVEGPLEPREDEEARVWRMASETVRYAKDLAEQQKKVEVALMRLALHSTDPEVRAMAHRLDTIDKMLEYVTRGLPG